MHWGSGRERSLLMISVLACRTAILGCSLLRLADVSGTDSVSPFANMSSSSPI